MHNNKEFNEYSVQHQKEIYEALAAADEILIETKWFTTFGERGYPEVDKLDGMTLELDDNDIYELVYGDASVSDFIVAFEPIAADSVASFEEYYEDLAEKTHMDRSDYPMLDNVQFTVYADGERVMWDTYYLGPIYKDVID